MRARNGSSICANIECPLQTYVLGPDFLPMKQHVGPHFSPPADLAAFGLSLGPRGPSRGPLGGPTGPSCSGLGVLLSRRWSPEDRARDYIPQMY
eukprot:9291255-Pyramimonas_sp.AAC.1